MKVFVNCSQVSLHAWAIKERIRLEEDNEIQERGKADVVIEEDQFASKMLAHENVQILYGAGEKPSRPVCYLSSIFDGEKWGDQQFVMIPMRGLMNEGIGPDVVTGCAVRAHETPGVFEKLTDVVRGLGWKGFVTLGLTRDGIDSARLGMPYFSMYAMMESVPTRLAEFSKKPLGERLRERWSVAILLSRHPYPMGQEVAREVEGLNFQLRKHFWTFNQQPILKERFVTSFTAIGVVTAWEHRIRDANERAMQTCRNIQVADKQYRTDLSRVVGSSWEEVEACLELARTQSSDHQLSLEQTQP